MKDAFGTEVNKGDLVAATNGDSGCSYLVKGYVTRITKCFFFINDRYQKNPDKVVLLKRAEEDV